MSEGIYTVLTMERLERSIKRARQLKPMVRVLDLDDRKFIVESANDKNRWYLVKFQSVKVEGEWEFRGTCHLADFVGGEAIDGEMCKGFERTGMCYHISSSAGVNYGLQKMRLDLRRKEREKNQKCNLF